MRPKTVNGVDGRVWQVRSSTDWHTPALGQDFEHDVSSNTNMIFLGSSLVVLWTTLIVWGMTLNYLIIPWYFWLAAVIVAAFFPMRWWLRRPMHLVAETPGDHEYPAERWVGPVRGAARAREEVRIIVRRIRTQGTPGHADSPLSPIEVGTWKAEEEPDFPSLATGPLPTIKLPAPDEEST